MSNQRFALAMQNVLTRRVNACDTPTRSVSEGSLTASNHPTVSTIMACHWSQATHDEVSGARSFPMRVTRTPTALGRKSLPPLYSAALFDWGWTAAVEPLRDPTHERITAAGRHERGTTSHRRNRHGCRREFGRATG